MPQETVIERLAKSRQPAKRAATPPAKMVPFNGVLVRGSKFLNIGGKRPSFAIAYMSRGCASMDAKELAQQFSTAENVIM
jgi:hypothetical protein